MAPPAHARWRPPGPWPPPPRCSCAPVALELRVQCRRGLAAQGLEESRRTGPRRRPRRRSRQPHRFGGGRAPGFARPPHREGRREMTREADLAHPVAGLADAALVVLALVDHRSAILFLVGVRYSGRIEVPEDAVERQPAAPPASTRAAGPGCVVAVVVLALFYSGLPPAVGTLLTCAALLAAYPLFSRVPALAAGERWLVAGRFTPRPCGGCSISSSSSRQPRSWAGHSSRIRHRPVLRGARRCVPGGAGARRRGVLARQLHLGGSVLPRGRAVRTDRGLGSAPAVVVQAVAFGIAR